MSDEALVERLRGYALEAEKQASMLMPAFPSLGEKEALKAKDLLRAADIREEVLDPLSDRAKAVIQELHGAQ